MYTGTLRFIINGKGVKINGGGFKDFEKLLNGGRVKISGGGVVETKYKRKETRIGLSLLTSLNISISSILRSRSKYQESIYL